MHAAAARQATFAANRAVGMLSLSVNATAGVTRRVRVREEGPLRVRCPGSPGPELEAVIVNTAGGMAGGDRFAIDIAVGRDARVVLTTAAAEKVYRTLGPDTTVDVTLAVGDHGELAWLPQETILFDKARLRRTIDVQLAATARLVLMEAIVFGRSGMGEIVEQGHVFDRWRIRRDGVLAYAESLRLDDCIGRKLAEPAATNGGVAVATIVLAPGAEETVEMLRGLAGRCRGEIGASAWNGIAVARIVAADGGALRHDLLAVLTAIRGQALPRLWLN